MGQPAGPGSAQGCSKNEESDVIAALGSVGVYMYMHVCCALTDLVSSHVPDRRLHMHAHKFMHKACKINFCG